MFNLPAGRFYLHRVIPSGQRIWAGFSLSYLSRKALGKEPSQGIAAASAREFCCPKGQDRLQGRDRRWKWARVGREAGTSLIEPGGGEQEGQGPLSFLLSIALASPAAGLVTIYCPQHPAWILNPV